MNFRVYLLDGVNHIRAAHAFATESEAEAADIGKTLFSSCDDVFTSCEVWQGPSRIYHNQTPLNYAGEPLAEMSERCQRLIVEMEETLWTSFSAIRESTKLLDRINVLRAQIGRPI